MANPGFLHSYNIWESICIQLSQIYFAGTSCQPSSFVDVHTFWNKNYNSLQTLYWNCSLRTSDDMKGFQNIGFESVTSHNIRVTMF